MLSRKSVVVDRRCIEGELRAVGAVGELREADRVRAVFDVECIGHGMRVAPASGDLGGDPHLHLLEEVRDRDERRAVVLDLREELAVARLARDRDDADIVLRRVVRIARAEPECGSLALRVLVRPLT